MYRYRPADSVSARQWTGYSHPAFSLPVWTKIAKTRPTHAGELHLSATLRHSKEPTSQGFPACGRSACASGHCGEPERRHQHKQNQQHSACRDLLAHRSTLLPFLPITLPGRSEQTRRADHTALHGHIGFLRACTLGAKQPHRPSDALLSRIMVTSFE